MSDTVAHRATVTRAEVACRPAACWALDGRPRGTPGSFLPRAVSVPTTRFAHAFAVTTGRVRCVRVQA